MTNAEHLDLFYNFVKHHEHFKQLTFGEPVENQQWIGVLVDGFKKDDGVYILEEWAQVYNDFINSSEQLTETIRYISDKVAAANTNEKVAEFITTYILARLKADNVQSEKVYVCISDNWNKTWFDSIEEV